MCAFLVPGEKTERERESGGEPHLTGNIQHRRVRYDDDDQPTTWHGGVGPMPRVCRHPLLAEAVVLMMSFLTLGDEYPYSFPIRALDAPTESSSDRLIQSFRLGFDQGGGQRQRACVIGVTSSLDIDLVFTRKKMANSEKKKGNK